MIICDPNCAYTVSKKTFLTPQKLSGLTNLEADLPVNQHVSL